MNVTEAFNLLNLSGEVTKAEIKKAYKKMSIKYHPDKNPANPQVMVAINAAYAHLNSIESDPIVQDSDATSYDFAEALQSVISSLSQLDGLLLEVCGNWLWVSGETKKHKEAIKETGCYFSRKKCMWYYRPSEYKSRSRKSHDISEIREMHGSHVVNTNTYNRYLN
ncbi:J domain-containing protein [Vibrio harveyi]|uniref:J domain-containing protein n=1 Tax=Vibrio harveyi TaxID=669 RepID=UPI003BB6FED1